MKDDTARRESRCYGDAGTTDRRAHVTRVDTPLGRRTSPLAVADSVRGGRTQIVSRLLRFVGSQPAQPCGLVFQTAGVPNISGRPGSRRSCVKPTGWELSGQTTERPSRDAGLPHRCRHAARARLRAAGRPASRDRGQSGPHRPPGEPALHPASHDPGGADDRGPSRRQRCRRRPLEGAPLNPFQRGIRSPVAAASTTNQNRNTATRRATLTR